MTVTDRRGEVEEEGVGGSGENERMKQVDRGRQEESETLVEDEKKITGPRERPREKRHC